MQKFRRHEGFTIFELMIVVAIMAVITALAVPSISRYRLTEAARGNAFVVAGALRNARDRAIREGVPHFVLFNAPASAPGAVARVVRDADGNYQEDAPLDVARDIFFNRPTRPEVTPYGMGAATPHAGAPRADNDPGAGNLGTVANGASFPIDPVTNVEGVGFTSRGVPVSMGNPPGAVGSGTGAYYVTDNTAHVYAVEVGPLGEIRVRSFNAAANRWD